MYIGIGSIMPFSTLFIYFRNLKGSSSYIKSFLRKGRALMGLGRHREAVTVFDEGVKLDPGNPHLKLGLQVEMLVWV
jgi:hypothetical protein